MIKESFELNNFLDFENIYSWVTYIKDVIDDIDLNSDRLNLDTTYKNVKLIKPYIKDELFKFYMNMYADKVSNLKDQNKIFLYKFLKNNLESKEFYLSDSNYEHRKFISKFRIADHSLEIERGRYKKESPVNNVFAPSII